MVHRLGRHLLLCDDAPTRRQAVGRGPVTPQRRGNDDAADQARLRRRAARELNTRDSQRVLTGMMGLLALCEYLSARPQAAVGAWPALPAPAPAVDLSPRDVLRAFGARPLLPGDAPDLYAMLSGICARAGLHRVPELYLLPALDMNAFALGAPDNACISATQGLLRGLSRAEIGGILAHEVAHIVNHDTGAMNWAAAIQNKIAGLAQHGVADLASSRERHADFNLQSMFLASTPAIARLLFLAFSRLRELDADALAVDLIDDPEALAAALSKLEHFHSGLSPWGAHLQHDARSRPWRSHPGTWERISRMAGA